MSVCSDLVLAGYVLGGVAFALGIAAWIWLTRGPKPTGVVMNWFDDRPNACVICQKPLNMRSITTRHPEAPEMLQIPHKAWMGIVDGDAGPEVIVACSERCVRVLVRE